MLGEHRATAGGMWMTRGQIWSETQVNEYELCRENKEEFTDAIVLTFISLQTLLMIENHRCRCVCGFMCACVYMCVCTRDKVEKRLKREQENISLFVRRHGPVSPP